MTLNIFKHRKVIFIYYCEPNYVFYADACGSYKESGCGDGAMENVGLITKGDWLNSCGVSEICERQSAQVFRDTGGLACYLALWRPWINILK